jgi:hypothetical protein
MLSNVHRTFLTYKCIHLNIFCLKTPDTTLLRYTCDCLVTQDLSTVYKYSRVNSTLAQALQIQSDGLITAQLRYLNMFLAHYGDYASNYSTPRLPRLHDYAFLAPGPSSLPQSTHPLGSFPLMEICVPNAGIPRASSAQPHHTTTQPPDVMNEEA